MNFLQSIIAAVSQRTAVSLESLHRKVDRLLNMQEKDFEALMDRLNTTTNALASSVATVKATVKDNDDRLREEILALRDQTTPVTQEQLDSLAGKLGTSLDALDQVSSVLQTIGADVTNPVPVLPPTADPAVA